MDSYQEQKFQNQMSTALSQIRTILENNRSPQLPANVSHSYEDKYLVVELLANTALAAQVNCLEYLGLTSKNIEQILKWGQNRSVTIRFKAEKKCVFDREHTYESSSPVYSSTTTGVFGTSTTTQKVVTKITDYYWTFTGSYELFAFQGNNVDDKIMMLKRSGTQTIITSVKTTPHPAVTVMPNIDVNIGYLISNINEQTKKLKFSIDRDHPDCRTPRRNPEINAALTYFRSFHTWCTSVNSYFQTNLFPIHTSHNYDLGRINTGSMFVPVLPLFETTEAKKANKGGSAHGLVALNQTDTGSSLNVNDINAFLDEHTRSIKEKISSLSVVFASKDSGGLISLQEATMCCVNLNAKQICEYFSDGVDYVEDMLRKQLIAAIGKEVTPVDFTNYMVFHNRKMFRNEYEPTPFSYAIRLPDHSPEGMVGIDVQLSDGSIEEPINTIVRSGVATTPMSFNINAATEISFYGERHIHSYVSHQFSGQSGQTLSLCARARQFSSFILLVGKIVSHTKFDPKAAMIIQNKDDFKIPLTFETIPTPKAFRDAIESLSPEQQRFAQAIRSMQLASTLFGIVVIQIKPQLEKLLRLPYDSLTKEIRMTQDLMNIFIKYQIPSDLISYAENDEKEDTRFDKITIVKKHMKAMQDMLEGKKDEELQSRLEEAVYAQVARQIPQQMPQPMPMPQVQYQSQANFCMPTSSSSAMSLFSSPIPQSAPIFSSFPGSSLPMPSPVSVPQQPIPTTQPTTTTTTTTTTSNNNTNNNTNNDSGKPLQVEKIEGRQKPEEGEDYTLIPGELDKKFEALDTDGALRPTIIDIGKVWTKKSQSSLLSPQMTNHLDIKAQEEERNKAFDLLDALSRSGCLAFDHAALHVVMATTHCFDKTLLNTVVQDNVNPIEKVERSVLIVATTIHNKTSEELVRPEVQERVATYSPLLFGSIPIDDEKEQVKQIEGSAKEPVISKKSTHKSKK